MNTDYRPTYACINGTDIYFDTIIWKSDTATFTAVAWGDGSHVNIVASVGTRNDGALRACDTAYHIDQLRSTLEFADSVIAVCDHKVVFKHNV